MNTNSNQNPGFPSGDELEKTFVEGVDIPVPAQPAAAGHTLTSGARIDATSIGPANPYAQKSAGQNQPSAPLPSGTLPDGTQPLPLGSGVIQGVLGAGGMAKIYKIWNEKLEVYRAVKVLIPGQMADLLSRFETEAKITAKLHHTNIVEIYNVGDWNGLPFLEMELIDGESLLSIIHRIGRLPPAVCCAISIFIARALAYAHSQEFLLYGKTYHGVIHRDLKPANIMVTRSGILKLMDFGIARPTETSLHTVDGNIVGTLQYLSPEQMDGINIDLRTDIYSFGAILYEMLTGTKTFPQSTITNLMKMKALNTYRQFEDYEFAIPSIMVKIAQRCLMVKKEERFEDANALHEALSKALRSLCNQSPEAVLRDFIADPSRPPAHTSRVATYRGRKIPLVPALAIGGGALVIAGVITALMLSPPEKPREETATETPKTAQTVAATSPATPAISPESEPATPPAPAVASSPVTSAPPTAASSATEPPATKPKPAVTTSRPPATASVPKKTPPAASGIERLKKQYGVDDLLAIGEKALQQGADKDAILALESFTPGSGAEGNKKSLLLMDAYLGNGDYGKARALNGTVSIQDAHLDLMRGKLEEIERNDKKALSYYEAAMTKPSILRGRAMIIKDALYFMATIYDRYYQNAPSAETRLRALNAWNNVKKQYLATPDHPRFKTANQKLASIH